MTKQELTNKYRDISVDHSWWDCIEDDLREDLFKQGFVLDKLYFSDFWSQGGGACFTGHMADWSKYIDSNPEFAKAFPGFTEYLRVEDGNYTITHTGRYYHSTSVTHVLNSDLDYNLRELALDIEGDPEAATIDDHMYHAIYKRAESECAEGEVETWLKEHFRAMMDDLYATLRWSRSTST